MKGCVRWALGVDYPKRVQRLGGITFQDDWAVLRPLVTILSTTTNS